jgi:hypothetical protein
VKAKVFSGAIVLAVAILTVRAGAQPPDAVLQELQSRGCQLPGKKSKGQVIYGEFFVPGQSDWAALCVAKKSGALLVFPNGSRELVEILEARPRRFSSWSIRVVPSEELNMLKSTGLWRRPVPAETDHQGIGSYVEWGDKEARCLYCFSAEDASYYYDQGQWLKPATMIAN